MISPQSDVLQREIRIAARPEIVFEFSTDPARMMRWNGINNTLDPRPGGIYRVDLNRRDVASGRFVEVIPYSRVVFTWGLEGDNSPFPPGASTVEVSLIPDGDGTIVRLRHSGLPANDPMDFGGAWDHALARLVIVAQGGDPGPDPWVESMDMPG